MSRAFERQKDKQTEKGIPIYPVARMLRVEELTGALRGEEGRWTEQMAEIQTDLAYLPGDTFLAAACIAYENICLALARAASALRLCCLLCSVWFHAYRSDI